MIIAEAVKIMVPIMDLGEKSGIPYRA